MSRKAKLFWAPWTAGMVLATLMLFAGGFVPTQAGAQAQAVAKVKASEKVAVAKVTAAERVASVKLLSDAKVAAAKVQASAPYIDVRTVPIVEIPASQPASVVAPVAVPVVSATPPFSVSVLLDWLLKLAGIALATLIPLLLNRWLGGKVSAEQLAAYSKLAVDAVGHSEELAHQALKSGASGLDSNAKANAAVAYVLQAADALKLRPMAEESVKKLIDAKLGTERTPATLSAPKEPDSRSDR